MPTLKNSPLLGIILVLLLAGSFLFTPNTPPLPSFYQEQIAMLAWGVLAAASCWAYLNERTVVRQSSRPEAQLLGFILMPAAWHAIDMTLRPVAYPMLALATVLTICAAAVVAKVAIYLGSLLSAESERGRLLVGAALGGMLLAGMVNAVFGLFQYVQIPLPTWLMSPLVILGRAYGNMRQPNLYALLLAWTWLLWVAHAARRESTRQDGEGMAGWGWVPLLAEGALLACAMAVSGSRAGGLFLWLIGAAAFFVPGLSRRLRVVMVLVPVLHALAWGALILLDQAEILPFYSTLRSFGTGDDFNKGDISNSRLGVWADVWKLVLQAPWLGHGFFSLNKGLMASPEVQAPILNFIHAHNILLHWAYEFGIFAVSAWCALGLAWLWSVRSALKTRSGSLLALALGLAAVHNLLEHPWWHVHFLLPSAFAAGLLTAMARAPAPLGGRATSVDPVAMARISRGPRAFAAASVLLIVLSVHALVDYGRMAPIYRSGANLPPLADRLQSAYQSVWFTHWVDQAVVGTYLPASADAAAMQCRVGKKVQNFFLGTHAALSTAVACAQAGDMPVAMQLLKAVLRSELQTAKEFRLGLTGPRADTFDEIQRRLSSQVATQQP